MNRLLKYQVNLWSPEGYCLYFGMILMGAISCGLVLRWTTSDSYNLPIFKNKKRLNFSTNLSDAGATSFYRVREQPKKKKKKE